MKRYSFTYVRTLRRTPACPFSPTIEEVREADTLSEKGDHAETTNNDWTIVHPRRDKAPKSHTHANLRGYFALEERQNIWTRGATRTSFRTVVRKSRRINYCTCLREYIDNVSFSDKYLIAEFYFKFN